MKSALLGALSGFWHRFFADLGDLDLLYAGTEKLAAQLYLDLLNEVVGQSVGEAPLFNREDHRLWRIRDDDLSYYGSSWRVRTPVRWASVRYLQDSITEPSTTLDLERDYTMGPGYVDFKSDPRALFSRAARRVVPLEVGGVFKDFDEDITGVRPGDVLVVGPASYEISFVQAGVLGLSSKVAVSATQPVANWSVQRSGISQVVGQYGELVAVKSADVTEIGVWAVDSQVDTQLIYRSFGGNVSGPAPSSEQYRSFVRGVTRLYALGPTLQRMQEALTAAAGLPLVRSDGEQIVSIDGTTVVTTAGTYELPPTTKMRADLVPGATLKAFQTLSDVVQVSDYRTNPTWWHGISVPERLMPGFATGARRATTQLFPNKIGTDYLGAIGDPDFTINAAPTWRRTAAYTLMDQVLKYNMFSVRLDPGIDVVPGTADSLQDLAFEARPSHTYAYVWPQVNVYDSAEGSDAQTRAAKQVLGDSLGGTGNWQIGTGAIGDHVGVSGTVSSTGLPLVIGGSHPSSSGGLSDGAVYVTRK